MDMLKTTPANAPRVINKRQHITTERKKQIIDAFKSKTLTEISRQFQLPRSTCQSILRNKDAIIDAIENGIGMNRARLTKGRNTNFDNALLLWARNLVDQKVLLTPSILREKALELANEMGVEGFQASNGWLDRFQNRNAIPLHRTQNESPDLNDKTINIWQQTVLDNLLARFDPQDVFSMDETEIYWQVQQNRKDDHSKRIKDRVTVLLAVNMTASEKLPLFVIGNSERLEKFENDEVAIKYVSNEGAWLTASIFIDWLNEWNRKLQAENRHVLLFLNECQAHPKIKLNNIKLKFFPTKMSSSTQPMNQGVLQSFKMQYRRMLPPIELILSNVVDHIRLPDALNYLYQAWEQVAPSTIASCFRKVGFIASNKTAQNIGTDNESDEEDNLPAMKTPEHMECETSEEFSTSSDFILAEIAKVCAQSEKSSNGNDYKDVMSAFEIVRQFVQQNTKEQKLHTICDILGNFIKSHQ